MLLLICCISRTKTKPDSGDIARISALDEEIEAAAAELEELEGDKEAIDQQIKALEKKILDIGGARLLSQKSKVDGLRLHINLANDEITKAEVAKAKAEKDVKKLRTVIENNTATLEEVSEELQKLEEELEECVQYVENIRSKVADAQTAAENSKDDLENLKAELDEKTEQIQAFRAKEVSLYSVSDDHVAYSIWCRWNSSKRLPMSRRMHTTTRRPSNTGRASMTSCSLSISSACHFGVLSLIPTQLSA